MSAALAVDSSAGDIINVDEDVPETVAEENGKTNENATEQEFDLTKLCELLLINSGDYGVIRKILENVNSNVPELLSKVITLSEAEATVRLLQGSEVKIEDAVEDGEMNAEQSELSGLQITGVGSLPLPISLKEEISGIQLQRTDVESDTMDVITRNPPTETHSKSSELFLVDDERPLLTSNAYVRLEKIQLCSSEPSSQQYSNNHSDSPHRDINDVQTNHRTATRQSKRTKPTHSKRLSQHSEDIEASPASSPQPNLRRRSSRQTRNSTKILDPGWRTSSSDWSSADLEDSDMDLIDSDADRSNVQVSTESLKKKRRKMRLKRNSRKAESSSETESSDGSDVQEVESPINLDEDGVEERNEMEMRRSQRKRACTKEKEYSSEDSSQEAQRYRALKKLKEKHGSSKKKSRISSRPKDSGSEEDGQENGVPKAKKALIGSYNQEIINAEQTGTEVVTVPENTSEEIDHINTMFSASCKRPQQGRKILSDSENSSQQDEENSSVEETAQSSDCVVDSDDSFIEKEGEECIMDEFRKMKDSLMRRDERFTALTEEYEMQAEGRQLGAGYDDSEDELKENKYPQKLIDNLRDAHEQLRKENPEDDIPPESSLTNDEIVSKWQLYDTRDLKNDHGEDSCYDGECICSKSGLRYLYFMRMRDVENWELNTRTVGSECIRWFCRARPNTSLIFIQRVVRDGCTILFEKQRSQHIIQVILCSPSLSSFLVEHEKDHSLEYKMPLKCTKNREGGDVVRLKLRKLCSKRLLKGRRYHVQLRPVIKPTKDLDAVPILDFVIENILERDGSMQTVDKQPTARSFFK